MCRRGALPTTRALGGCQFRSPTLSLWEAFRFYGNQCEHFTCANTTATTRVSFDFRTVPSHLHDPGYKDHQTGQANAKLQDDGERAYRTLVI